MKLRTIPLAALAAFTLAGPASAATLLTDNFNTEKVGASVFNDAAALTADQSGPAATKTYTTYISGGWDGAYQRGNGGTWLMHAGQDGGTTNGFGGTDKRGSLNYDIAAVANTIGTALAISFNMSVSGEIGDSWATFTVGSVNPVINADSPGFGSLFRDSGATEQYSNNASLGSTPTFTDGQLITFVLSDATGSGSAFDVSNGANDIVKMYVGGSLTNTFTGLNLDATDQYISFHANNVIANIDNLSIATIPEPGAALLGSLGMLCLLRRRR